MSFDRATFPFAAPILLYIAAKVAQAYEGNFNHSLDSLLLEFAGIQLFVYLAWRYFRYGKEISVTPVIPFGLYDETSDECLWFGIYGSFGLFLAIVYTTQPNTSACLPLGLLFIIASFTKYLDYPELDRLHGNRRDAKFIFTEASPREIAEYFSQDAEYYAQFYPPRKPTIPEYFYPDFQPHIGLWVPFAEFAYEAIYFPQWKLNYLTLVISLVATLIALKFTRDRAYEKYHRRACCPHKYFCIFGDFDENDRIINRVWPQSNRRHPLFRAQFYYALSLQIILLNPLSTIAMIIPVWLSLRERIHQEEAEFINRYGDCYRLYQACIPSGVPLIDYELRNIEPIYAYL